MEAPRSADGHEGDAVVAAPPTSWKSIFLRDFPFYLEKLVLPFAFMLFALQALRVIFVQHQISRLLRAFTTFGPFSETTSIYATSIALSLSLFAFDLITLYLLVRQTRPRVNSRSFKEIVVPLAATFGIAGLNLTGFMPALMRERFLTIEISRIVYLPALVCAFAGSLLAIISILHLGRSFSIAVQARDLVVKGPYRFVRHPMYTSELCLVVAIATLRPVVAALVLSAAVFALTLYRSRLEERLLVETFPPYRDYMKKVGRFVPWVGRVG